MFHPNIVLLMGACTNPDLKKNESIKICMELCETSLESLLTRDRENRKHNKPVLSILERIQLGKQLVCVYLFEISLKIL